MMEKKQGQLKQHHGKQACEVGHSQNKAQQGPCDPSKCQDKSCREKKCANCTCSKGCCGTKKSQ
ncbi:MAG: hypothetical protein ACOYKZ_06340 [Chlamydiia bacterium]